MSSVPAWDLGARVQADDETEVLPKKTPPFLNQAVHT